MLETDIKEGDVGSSDGNAHELARKFNQSIDSELIEPPCRRCRLHNHRSVDLKRRSIVRRVDVNGPDGAGCLDLQRSPCVPLASLDSDSLLQMRAAVAVSNGAT